MFICECTIKYNFDTNTILLALCFFAIFSYIIHLIAQTAAHCSFFFSMDNSSGLMLYDKNLKSKTWPLNVDVSGVF